MRNQDIFERFEETTRKKLEKRGACYCCDNALWELFMSSMHENETRERYENAQNATEIGTSDETAPRTCWLSVFCHLKHSPVEKIPLFCSGANVGAARPGVAPDSRADDCIVKNIRQD